MPPGELGLKISMRSGLIGAAARKGLAMTWARSCPRLVFNAVSICIFDLSTRTRKPKDPSV
jgi:hypothetical protein